MPANWALAVDIQPLLYASKMEMVAISKIIKHECFNKWLIFKDQSKNSKEYNFTVGYMVVW